MFKSILNMQRQITFKTKLLITGLVALFAFSIIFWEHLNSGVLSHHFLQQENLPEISNWWNGLMLPIITWILLERIDKRLNKKVLKPHQSNRQYPKLFLYFITGLTFAILISISFVNGYTFFLDNVLYAFLIVSFVIPIFYSEFLLGFILGMTFTFGVILPTIFVLIIASLGFIIYRFLRPVIIKGIAIFRNQFIANPKQ